MFKLGPAAYWWPVEVSAPVDGGKVELMTFQAQYRYLDVDEHNALMAELTEKQLDDRAFCRRVVIGLKEVADTTGAALQFTPENFDLLMRQPCAACGTVATAITRRYFESRQQDLARGNSQRPPVGGLVAAHDSTTHH